MSLLKQETRYLEKKLGKKPTKTEFQIVAAEWSEHCSYKSSKKHLKILPKDAPYLITEKGYDSGVIDVGDDYVVTVHIESHNHPSAVEPYGGAATGVGGVIRDILSTGTRPIAVLDSLRFGNIQKDSNAKWLFKNAVSGIADYGNCIGIPTIGGEVEFDETYTNYALVDVAAIGFGKKDRLIKNSAKKGDVVVLIGGPTGRDGIGGAQFASDSLESENRSAVQIPDPFIEKLIIEAILEARNQNCILAMKDLGGGGLSCAISETADSLSVGIELDVTCVHTREEDMTPEEIMISESQERMLVITKKSKVKQLKSICKKFHVACSVIGKVLDGDLMQIKNRNDVLAQLPASLVANAPLIDRPSKKPAYLSELNRQIKLKPTDNFSNILKKMLENPNIASKIWVYSQYDHEVGIRTVIKPGFDAAVLRLDNGKFLAAKIDGNPKHCYLNPREGAIGCFEEACRNVVCTGAKPIGMVDHLQFGNPENPEIFWTFLESLSGLSDFASYFKIPCVGGKVSFYNETPLGPIKPTPLIGVLGLIEGKPLRPISIKKNDLLLIMGETKDEMGGSEYAEYIHNLVGGKCPTVDFKTSKKNMDAVYKIIQSDLVKIVHDCSKGGLSVAILELCMHNDIGCKIQMEKIPSAELSNDKLLFSETHSRYLVVLEKKNLKEIENILRQKNVIYNVIGEFGSSNIIFEKKSKSIAKLQVRDAKDVWLSSLEGVVLHG